VPGRKKIRVFLSGLGDAAWAIKRRIQERAANSASVMMISR